MQVFNELKCPPKIDLLLSYNDMVIYVEQEKSIFISQQTQYELSKY